jgi:thiamine transporter 2/3
MAIATVGSFFLPSVGQSVYFHRASDSDDDNSISTSITREKRRATTQSQQSNNSEELLRNKNMKRNSFLYKIKNAYALLWKHFVQAYTNYRVLKWSAWWALSTCGYLLITMYSQLLWQTAVKRNDRIYNGAVDFLYAIVGKEKALLYKRERYRVNFIKLK